MEMLAGAWNNRLLKPHQNEYSILLFHVVGVNMRILQGVFPARYIDGLRRLDLSDIEERPTFKWFPQNPQKYER